MIPWSYVMLRCRVCAWSRYEASWTDAGCHPMQRRMRTALDDHQRTAHQGRDVVSAQVSEYFADGYARATA